MPPNTTRDKSVALGRKKLTAAPIIAAPITPPNRPAGLLGGVIGAAIIGAAVSFFLPNATLLSLVVFGGILAVISQIGDLFESSLKRKYEMKDSGGILPGHGGMLDRLDARRSNCSLLTSDC